MGSGSFGGGSGSFGGGSGGGGGGGGSGAGSAHDRIFELTELTRSVNENPALAPMRAKIYELVRDHGRSVLLKGAMGEASLVSAYGKLLSFGRAINGGQRIESFAGTIGVPQTGTLDQLARKVVGSSSGNNADERVKRAIRVAVKNLLMEAVGGDEDHYYRTELQDLGDVFDAAPLADTAGAVLAKVLETSVRADLLNLSALAEAAVSTACREIARSWVDKFRSKYEANTRGGMKGIFGAIAENYRDFTGVEA